MHGESGVTAGSDEANRDSNRPHILPLEIGSNRRANPGALIDREAVFKWW